MVPVRTTTPTRSEAAAISFLARNVEAVGHCSVPSSAAVTVRPAVAVGVLVGAALLAFFVRGCLYSLVGEGLSDLLTSAAAVLAALVVADVLHPIARSLRVAFAELAARARWIVRAVRALLRGEPMPSLEQEADRIRCEMETAGLVDRGW